MRIRTSDKFKRETTGFLCACLWLIALAGFTTIPDARAKDPRAPGPPPAGDPPVSIQTTVVQGTVAQYLMNPDGVVDGLLLTNNTIVRFPPHLGQVLAQTVDPQDVVRVEGSFEVTGTIHASSIVDLQSQRSVVDVPPSPKHPRPPRPGSVNRQPLSASGTIRVLTHAKHGEIDGAVLSDGTIVHFPPPVGSQFSALMEEGHSLAATGYGTANEYGRSLEANALGPSLSELHAIAPAPRLQSMPADTLRPPPSPPR